MKDLLKEYLPQVNIMQLATCVDNQPWACNLHYYSDDNFCLYWLSTPERRHSVEIEKNPQVAAAIMVHENSENEDYVIGVSLEGVAQKLDRSQYDSVINGFKTKHGTSEAFLNKVAEGTNPHCFYALRPTKITLFDTKNFPDRPRQELEIS